MKSRSASPPLARNIALNVGARGVLLVLSIAITPVLVRRLGTDQYGIYALATGLGAGLTNVLALGLIPGIVAMLSRALADESDREAEKIVGTAFTLFAVIGSIGGVVLAVLVPLLVNQVLRIPADLRPVAATALWLSAAGLAVNLVFAVFNAIPYALQRYDVIAGRLVGLSLVSTAATVVYVLVQASLTAVMVIQVLSGVAGVVLYYAVSRRELAGIRLRPGFDSATFRRLASFTAFKSVGDAALIFESRFDQFAIGSLLGVGALGIYAIPANACQRVLQLLGEVAGPMYPRMSAAPDEGARRAVLVRGSRLVALAAAPMTAVLLVLAEPILRLWIGGDQGLLVAREASGAFRLLTGAMFLQAVVVVAALYCESLQRPVINNSFTLLGAVVLVPAVLLAVPRYGIAGAAGAVLLMSSVQSLPLLVVVAHGVARVGLARFMGEALIRPIVSALLAGALGFALKGFATGLAGLLAVGLAMAAVYVVAAALTGAIRAGDLAQARKMLPAGWAHRLALPGLERWLRS